MTIARFRSPIEPLEARIAPAALASYNLADLDGTNGFKLSGVAAGDNSGTHVGGAGDVNGDGFDDVIVAAPGVNGSAGACYVVFGKATGLPANLELSTLDGTNGFKLSGAAANDIAGTAVNAAGDVNADGFGDLIVCASGADLGLGGATGTAYVIFGKADFSGTAANVDLGALTGSDGFAITNSLTGVLAREASGAGDVNGDGFDDVIVSADSLSDNPGEWADYVVFGKAAGFSATLDVSAIDGTNGVKLIGAPGGGRMVGSVSRAGDVNGDGFADVIVGAYQVLGLNTGTGVSYVVYGRASFPASVSIASLDGSDGFAINGPMNGGEPRFGSAVSTAGDVNGDGLDDVIVGAWFARVGVHGNSGASYVVFGKTSRGASVDAAALTGTDGFRLSGGADNVFSARSVSTAGDVNGDGFDDLLVGASGAGVNYSGATYVVLGKASGFTASLDLPTLNGADGFRIVGVAAFDAFGRSVSAAGDVNGDGFDDIIAGAYRADPHGSYSGASYVVFGFDTGAVTHPGDGTANTLTGTIGADVMIGGRGGDTLTGNGGADVQRGGEGADVFAISDLNFHRIAGGSGIDTLRLDGSGLTLDLKTNADNRLTGIERIDITGSGNNTLFLNQHEILALSASSNTLIVDGDAGDRVFVAAGFAQGADEVVGLTTYAVFTQGAATLKVAKAAAIEIQPTISVTDVNVTEGDTGTVDLVFTVSLSHTSLLPVTVSYATANATAVAPADYTAHALTMLTFAPGETTKTITVAANGDTSFEDDETFVVNLSAPGNATLAKGQGIGTINDDDPMPSLTIDDASVAEGDAGTTDLVFTVKLSAASGQPVTVSYVTANDTAFAPADYAAQIVMEFVFEPGETSKTIAVPVIGNTLYEDGADKTFFVNLSDASGATLGDAHAVGTILNDDTAPTNVDMVAAKDPFTFFDSNHDKVTVKLTGNGNATVVLVGDALDNADISEIRLTGTDAKSVLTVTVAKDKLTGDGFVSVGKVSVDGDLKAFTGKAVDFDVAGFYASGSVRAITAHDLRTGGIFTGGADTDTLALTLGSLSDGFAIQTPEKISTFKAVQIGSGVVKAAALGALTTSAGSINADLDIAGILGSIAVKGGSLGGEISADRFGPVAITGGDFTGALNALSTPALLGKTPALKSLTITNGDLTGDVRAIGTIGPIAVKAAKNQPGGNITGATIYGSAIASLSVAHEVATALILAGADLGADHTLGGGDDTFAGGTIGTVKITGNVSGATTIGAGLSTTNTTLKDVDDAILGGAASLVKSFTIAGTADADSYFAAGLFKATPKIAGAKVVLPDSRFKTA